MVGLVAGQGAVERPRYIGSATGNDTNKLDEEGAQMPFAVGSPPGRLNRESRLSGSHSGDALVILTNVLSEIVSNCNMIWVAPFENGKK